MIEALALLEGGEKALDLLKCAVELVSKYETEKAKIFTRYLEPAIVQLWPAVVAYVDNIQTFRHAVLDDVDIHLVPMNALTRERMDRNARGVWS
jgi:hypothetical protein